MLVSFPQTYILQKDINLDPTPFPAEARILPEIETTNEK